MQVGHGQGESVNHDEVRGNIGGIHRWADIGAGTFMIISSIIAAIIIIIILLLGVRCHGSEQGEGFESAWRSIGEERGHSKVSIRNFLKTQPSVV